MAKGEGIIEISLAHDFVIGTHKRADLTLERDGLPPISFIGHVADIEISIDPELAKARLTDTSLPKDMPEDFDIGSIKNELGTISLDRLRSEFGIDHEHVHAGVELDPATVAKLHALIDGKIKRFKLPRPI